jgi:type VI secretion system protein ImpA
VQIEALLTEISPEAACGPDLEYDAEFMALDQAAQSKAEQQFGDTIVPAVEPNWRDVLARAEALFARTKDLRVAMLLTRALLRQSEFPGLCDGLTLLHLLLERYWDLVYPRIEAEYDNDPTMRLNALGALLDPYGFVRDLRAIHLIPPGAKGRVTVRDVLVALGKLPAGTEEAPSTSQIHGIVRDNAEAHAAIIDAAKLSLQTVRSIQALLNDRLGVDRSLDLQPLTEILELTVKTCDAALGQADAGAQAGDVSLAATATTAPRATAAPGEIRSREDAIRMLERVCEFMERTEPSNPAPLLIRRAQRLVSKNFIEIMEDLAPESLGAIKGIAGI